MSFPLAFLSFWQQHFPVFLMAPKLTWLFSFNRNNSKFYMTHPAKESLIFCPGISQDVSKAAKPGLCNCCCKGCRNHKVTEEKGVREGKGRRKWASFRLLFLNFVLLLNWSIYRSCWTLIFASPLVFPVDSMVEAGVEGHHLEFSKHVFPGEHQSFPFPWKRDPHKSKACEGASQPWLS